MQKYKTKIELQGVQYGLLSFCLFISIFSNSCKNKNTTLYSPYLAEQEIIITGQVENFDVVEHPGSIQFTFNDFGQVDGYKETVFLDSLGRFKINLHNNIVQNYALSYGSKAKIFLAKPGDSIHMELSILEILKNDQSVFGNSVGDDYSDPEFDFEIFTNAPVTYQSLFLMDHLYDEKKELAFWDSLWTHYLPAGDLLSMKSFLLNHEYQVQHRLDSILTSMDEIDPMVKNWIQQEVQYRYKSQLFHLPLMKSRETKVSDMDSLFHLIDLDWKALDLGEQSVYNTTYKSFANNLRFTTNTLSRDRILQLRKEQNYRGLIDFHIQSVRRNFDGFQEEFLTTQVLDWWLDSPEHAQLAEVYIDSFIANSSNYRFTRLLSEKYSNVLDSTQPIDISEKMMDIPVTVQNIFPEIRKKHQGKVLVLDFWATWCGPCLGHFRPEGYPRFIPTFKDQEVSFIFLAKRSPVKHWEKMVAEFEFEGEHILLNNEQEAVMDKLFGITYIPRIIVIDKEGNMVPHNAPGPSGMLEGVINSLL